MTEAQVIDCVDMAAELGTVINVGFAGGEPFLPSMYPCMLLTAQHVHDRYGTWLSVSTNAYWASSHKKATALLKPLVDLGLRTMLVSCDDFHLQSVPISCVATCLEVANELDVECTVQTITIRGSRRSSEFREFLKQSAGPDTRWIDNACAPVGRAAYEVPVEDLELSKGIPIGHCTLFRVLNVDPDWTVRPCCGSGLVAKRLAVGNLQRESFVDIDRRMRVDPLLNMLSLWGGPLGLAKQLAVLGQPEQLDRPYSCACHACHAILSDERAMAALDPFLKENRDELLARLLQAEEEFGLNHRIVRSNDDDTGGLSQVPGGKVVDEAPETAQTTVTGSDPFDP